MSLASKLVLSKNFLIPLLHKAHFSMQSVLSNIGHGGGGIFDNHRGQFVKDGGAMTFYGNMAVPYEEFYAFRHR